MSTGRKVGVLAILVLSAGIITYYALQGGSEPRVSRADADPVAAEGSDEPGGGVHAGDPSMTGGSEPRQVDANRADEVLRALADTERPAGSADADTTRETDPTGDDEVEPSDLVDRGAAPDGSAEPDGVDAGEGSVANRALAYELTRSVDGSTIDPDPFSMDDQAGGRAGDAPVAAANGGSEAGEESATPGTRDAPVAGRTEPGRGQTLPAGGDDAEQVDEADSPSGPDIVVQRTDRPTPTPRIGGRAEESDASDDEPDDHPTARETGPQRGERTYTVQPGDSLWTIASKTLGSGAKWQKIADANPDIGKDTVLQPGMTLKIPEVEGGTAGRVPEPRQVAAPTRADPLGLGLNRDVREITVRENESLWTIAQREYGDGTKFRIIYLANRDRMDDPQDLHPGDKLRVPPLPED